MGDEGGLVVHHAGGDFPAALGLVDAASFRHAAHVGRGVAVGEVDAGAVCAGRGMLAAGGVAANQDGAAGGCGLAGGRKYVANQLQTLSILVGNAGLSGLLRHGGDVFFDGVEADVGVGLPLWRRPTKDY